MEFDKKNRMEAFIHEIKQEAESTRNLLALIPFDKLDFKPHEKSMTLKALSFHVAEISGWWKECLVQDELDFSKMDYKPKDLKTVDELLALHDDLVEKSIKILNNVTEDDLMKPWTMRNAEQIYFTAPKVGVVRTWCMNHLYHHRGQLTVYLRLLNVPLPATYGTSADLEGK